jgi:ABC-2 type transport system ATP-binding protein
MGGVIEVSMRVPYRSVYALCGAKGAGKTTTLSVLAGLLFAESGSLTIEGKSIPLDRWAPRPGLGFVADTPVLDEALTPWQWSAFIASLKHAERRRDALAIAETLTLSAKSLDDPIHTLSPATRRKVALWTEFVTATTVIVMDEPLVGLDPAAIRGFHAVVRDFVSGGRAVIMSTQLLHEAEAMATHVGVIVDGITRAEGRLADVCGPRSLLATFMNLATKRASND